MNFHSRLRPRILAATIASVVVSTGLDAAQANADSAISTGAATFNRPAIGSIANATAPALYIVRFVEPPLALYNEAIASNPKNGVSGISAIPFKTFANGRNRLDVNSVPAKSYVQFLRTQQQTHLTSIANALGMSAIKPQYTMQHALNAALLQLTPAQAKAVSAVAGVVAVERSRPQPLVTDIGPGFIGASSLWWGAPAGQDSIFANGFDGTPGFRGDGMVVGDIDTGYNSLSPSFQPTDMHGYTVHNPLGTGNFLGQCSLGGGATGISDAGCNDKVIGAYDMVDLTGSCSGTCPSQYSVEDTQGHGSHTASTAAGDARMATLDGYTAAITGVAPHANLVIYYACSPDPNVQCSSAATTASVDQAIADGVVDALNFSIGGGTSPWNDSTSLAFNSAADAGIFVAAAAGNTQTSAPPLPGSANHLEPWVTTVAAGTHTGGAIGFLLTLNASGAPGPIPLTPAVSGTGLSAPMSNSAIKVSPTFNSPTDGCSAYPANTFSGAIAVITWTSGQCGTNTRAGNARIAGATAVVIVGNVLSGANQTIPVWTTDQILGTQMATFLGSNPTTTANVAYPASRLPTQPDVLADFSLLGPAYFDVIKPDVQAPGVNILAAVANDGTSNGPNLVALYDGTSMATPHTTGSGALLLGLHPGWTPAEAKSALMMTGKEAGLTKPDGTTPSDYFDRGSGRLQDFIASQAGLVLNETGLNFANADPAIGGDPTTLNIASMQNANCIYSCTFSRKFTSTQNQAVTWIASVANGPNPGINTVTVSPSTFTIGVAPARLPVTFTVDSSALPSDGSFHFAEVTLTPNVATLPPLHLTVAVSVPPPTIAAAPNPLSITGVATTSANSTLNVFNVGGPTLNVTQTSTGTVPFVWANQPSTDNYGYTSTKYTGLASGDTDYFAADDFYITGNTPVDISQIAAPGFANAPLGGVGGLATQISLRIYSDAGGVPSSDPDTGGAAVFSANLAPNAPGVDLTGGTYGAQISINMLTANLHTALPAGHYWLVVYPTMACADGGSGCTNFWYWLTSTNGSAGTKSAVSIAPQQASPAWNSIDPTTGAGLAMNLTTSVTCAAPTPSWLSAATFPLNLAGTSSAQLTVTATAPIGGSNATAYLCLGSNDPVTPVLPVQVNAAQ